jgi:putative transposase
MTRPLRREFAGALYHVTSRGDRSDAIFRDGTDRRVWLAVLGKVCARCNFVVHAFCQMTNHYHLVVETIDGHLADGMRELNSGYAQYFNRRHALVGHVFQGRYHAVLVQKQTHLLELSRYVVLNPLRAGMVTSLHEWHWSSYHYMTGEFGAPGWVETDWLLAQFGDDRAHARNAYVAFVMAGRGFLSPLRNVRHQMELGNEMKTDAVTTKPVTTAFAGIARVQRRSVALSLDDYVLLCADRDDAMAQAYASAAYSMQEIARYFGMSARTVSRAIKRATM